MKRDDGAFGGGLVMTRLLNRKSAPRTPRTATATNAITRSAIHTGSAEVMALSSALPAYTFSMTTVTATMTLAAPVDRVFAFHADVRNLPRLTPGPARIISAPVPTAEGDLQQIALGVPPLTLRWDARIVRFDPPRLVVDEQERGPFRAWRHTHAVIPLASGALLVDSVDFRFFPGRVGGMLDRLVAAPVLRLLFAVQHARTRRIFAEGSARP